MELLWSNDNSQEIFFLSCWLNVIKKMFFVAHSDWTQLTYQILDSRDVVVIPCNIKEDISNLSMWLLTFYNVFNGKKDEIGWFQILRLLISFSGNKWYRTTVF